MKKKPPQLIAFAFSIFKFSNLQIFKFNLPYKRIILQVALIFTFSNFHYFSFAQDSSHIRISLLTCTPGEELYSTFGHTAIRVTDSSSVTDYVFNYGTFNFEEPGFYTKFVRGKLLYYLSVENFPDFKYAYQAENRGITEQLLNMSPTEKTSLMEALNGNAKDQNKFYKYDFFLDNCTTRARDILVKFKATNPAFKPVMPPGTRFRQAIHQYLDMNEKYWSKLGIDLLLGEPTDAVMTTAQSQFLPDNLMVSFDSSNVNHELVLSTTNLYPVHRQNSNGSFFTPMIIFSLLFIIIVLLHFFTNHRLSIFLEGFNGIFFFLTGAMGLLFIFMWIGTDHSMTKNNYNLIWAWPTNTIVAFFINSKQKWARKYFGVSSILLILVLLMWFSLPQQLNNALIPVTLLLIFISAKKYLKPLS